MCVFVCVCVCQGGGGGSVARHGGVLGTAVVPGTRGGRQGLSTFCFLFVIFVNELLKLIKNVCQPEPFLGRVHILMMDDTVLLSATRTGIARSGCFGGCKECGMKVNCAKAEFFVVDGEAGDE